MTDLAGGLARLYQRFQAMVALGRVTASDDRGPTQMLQVRFGETDIRDGIGAVTMYGVASRPLPGADAVVVMVGGNRSDGLVIATGDRRYKIQLAPGEVALHTDEGDAVHLKRGRVVKIIAGSRLEIDAPLVQVTGDVIAGGVSLRNHRHGGVQPGGGNSGVPV